MLILTSNESIKVAHLQQLANQSMVNGVLVMEIVTILLVKARKTLVFWWSNERFNRIISTRFRYISKLVRGAKEQESW